jgi:hypothetical protein
MCYADQQLTTSSFVCMQQKETRRAEAQGRSDRLKARKRDSSKVEAVRGHKRPRAKVRPWALKRDKRCQGIGLKGF